MIFIKLKWNQSIENITYNCLYNYLFTNKINQLKVTCDIYICMHVIDIVHQHNLII